MNIQIVHGVLIIALKNYNKAPRFNLKEQFTLNLIGNPKGRGVELIADPMGCDVELIVNPMGYEIKLIIYPLGCSMNTTSTHKF